MNSKDIESKAFTSSKYLLTNTINGTTVEGIFTSSNKAERYMYRLGTNFMVSIWNDNGIDVKDLSAAINDFVDYNFEIIRIACDVKNPIYVCMNFNYHVYGKPSEYLTSSLEQWKSNYKQIDDSWSNKCTVLINPKLPKLDQLKII